MQNRRAVLAGLLASGLCPAPSWADAGSPRYLSAAKRPDGAHRLCGLSASGAVVFEVPIPARGHAAAAHPTRPLAVAFARRPGTFAIVIDCRSGKVRAQLAAPEGRHFYGHGAFSAEGDLLFTTENEYAAARGIVGIWDTRDGFRRVAEVSSGGVGPHDIRLMPDGRALAVANGGIETHPETGRTKLNIPTMRPNLSIMDFAGHVQDRIEIEPALSKNSIRHLAVNQRGDVAFAMQWQGDVSENPPLLGVRSMEGNVGLISPNEAAQHAKMLGYAGSVAFSKDGQRIAITSPRGGVGQVYDTAGEHLVQEVALPDTSGVAGHDRGFMLTSGDGAVCIVKDLGVQVQVSHQTSWDNHLVAFETDIT